MLSAGQDHHGSFISDKKQESVKALYTLIVARVDWDKILVLAFSARLAHHNRSQNYKSLKMYIKYIL